jgi:DNA-binding IclR family transcriptional regulator
MARVDDESGGAAERPQRRRAEEGLKSLSKVMAVLECFSISARSLSVGEIAERLDYPPSTTHRLLSSMREVGLLEQDRQRGNYRLGLRLFEFGNLALANLDLHREAMADVDALSRVTALSVHLAVFDGFRAVVIRAVPARPDERTMPATMLENAPVHCTGVGKAALAFQDEAVVERVIDAGLERFTEHTLVDPAALKAELAAIRRRGFAVDECEHRPGVRCVAAPIRDETGRVFAAVSTSGPTWSVTAERIPELAQIVTYHADRISRRLGHEERETGARRRGRP